MLSYNIMPKLAPVIVTQISQYYELNMNMCVERSINEIFTTECESQMKKSPITNKLNLHETSPHKYKIINPHRGHQLSVYCKVLQS